MTIKNYFIYFKYFQLRKEINSDGVNRRKSLTFFFKIIGLSEKLFATVIGKTSDHAALRPIMNIF